MCSTVGLLFSSSDDSDSESQPKKKIYKERINFSKLGEFEFKEKFRLSAEEVEFVLSKIGSRLEHKTQKNKALSPNQQLLTALHWLGNGGQYHGISDMHGISKATVCRVIKKVISAIVEELFQETVTWPTQTNNLAIDFLRKGGFPSVGGLIDGTLITIDAPVKNEKDFVDRHGNHSLNCLMACGPDHTFYYVSSRWPGSVHDSRVLRASSLSDRFESGWRPFPDAVLLGKRILHICTCISIPMYIHTYTIF
jgi:hypothetical protein